MEFKIFVSILWLNAIRLCYQQDIPACEIGSEPINGVCVKTTCQSTHELINGSCHPKPISSCDIGFGLVNGVCTQLNCQNNYVLENGVCRPNTVYPSYSSTTIAPSVYCPYGYVLVHGMCYHNSVSLPSRCQQRQCGIFHCPSTCTPYLTETTTVPSTTSTSTTTTTTTTTTTLPPPAKILLRNCPSDSVLINGKCRLIYCPKGTVHNGRCLEPVCTDGLVWTGLTCGKPELITTILEIENKFITEFNQTGPTFQEPKITSNIVYHTEPYETVTEKQDCRTTTTTTTEAPGEVKKCCTIITPRICKQYEASSRWVCSNKQYKRCDGVCNNSTMIYLRIPKIISRPPVVVMPPHPPLEACTGPNCDDNEIGCSGCANNQKAGCSPYCYSYSCPKNRCKFINQSDYCTTYPGSQGCTSDDGCYEEWCS